MSIFEVSNRGARGLSAAEQAFLAGQIAVPTQVALDAFLRAPALAAATAAGADVDALIVATGEAFSAEKAALDDHVVVKDGEIDSAIGAAVATTALTAAQGAEAVLQAARAAAQADAIGDISAAQSATSLDRAVAENARDAAIGAAGTVRTAPGLGLMPASTSLVAAASIGTDGRPVELSLSDGRRYRPLGAIWDMLPSLDAVRDAARALAVVIVGPGLGLIPGTTALADAATLATDGRATVLTGVDGAQYFATPAGTWTTDGTPMAGPGLGLVPGTSDAVAAVTLGSDGRATVLETAAARWTPTVTGGWSAILPAAYVGPGLGLVPSTVLMADEVTVTVEGRPMLVVAGSQRYRPDSVGQWQTEIPVIGSVPGLGLVPGTVEAIVTATLAADGRPIAVQGDGSATGVATLLAAGPGGLVPVGAPTPAQAFIEPATIESIGSSVPVPAGSLAFPGDRTAAWTSVALNSPATTSDVVTGVAIAAGVGTQRWLAHAAIVSVQSVVRTSDSAPMASPADYTIDLTRGLVTNVSGAAMTIAYTGSRERKDIVAIDPRIAAPVPVIALGTEQQRNGHLYAGAVPAGFQEIGRITRKGTRALWIPTYRWRRGIRIDRESAEAEARDYNRRALAPFISRLHRGLPVLVIAGGNSRVAIANNGNYAKLNVNHGSSFSADDTQSWYRDTPAYYALYSQADRGLFGFDDASRIAFDRTPGFNLTNAIAGVGQADGFGAFHVQAGYVWELLRSLNLAYPTAPIAYHNWGIGGTNSAATMSGDGRANALYPARWDAVQADITSWVSTYGRGSVLYIPVDPMNEPSDGGQDSYNNWVRLAKGASALGAVVHFMGNGRPDPRFQARDQAMAALEQEMARAAWDTGSAHSDAWRMIGPASLCGLGLIDDELVDATLQNHEGVPHQRAVGRDAAKNYI